MITILLYILCVVTGIVIAFLVNKFFFNKIKERIDSKLISAIFNSNEEGILLVDFYTRKIIDCNDYSLKILECNSKENLIDKDRDFLIVDKLSEKELVDCRKELGTEGSWKRVVKHKTIRNKTFDAEITITPLIHAKKSYYVTKIKDVTKEINKQNNLQKTDLELSTIIQNIDNVVYVNRIINNKRKLTYLSPKSIEIFGIEADVLKEKINDTSYAKLIHEEDRERIVKYFTDSEVKKLREPEILEYRVLNNLIQKYIWIEEKVYPQINHKGELLFYLGVITDISVRKHQQNKLIESEERYRTLFERNLAGVYRARVKDKVILDCNNAFANILGYEKREDIINQVSSLLYNGSSDQGKFHDRILEEKSIVNHESKLILKNGKEVWILESSKVISPLEGDAYVEGTLIDISERKKTEKALSESENNILAIVNNLDDVVYNVKVDIKGNKHFAFLSNHIEDLIGMSSEKYITAVSRNELIAYFHPDDFKNVLTAVKTIKETKRNTTISYRFLNPKTNNYVWLEESIYPQLDENGRIISQMGIIRNVTQDREKNKQIQLSEKRTRTLIERNLAGVFRSKFTGEIIECNPAFANILGYPKSELINKNAVDMYFFPKQRENYLQEIRQKQHLTNYELFLKKKNGKEVWVLANVSLVTYNNEEFIEGTVINITELKQTGEALIEKENELSTLMDNIPGALYKCSVNAENKTFQTKFISEGVAKLTGYPVEYFYKNAMNTLKEKAFVVEESNSFDKIKKEGNYELEYKITSKKGKAVWILEKGKAIYTDSGELMGVEGIVNDITERKTAETKIKEAGKVYENLIENSPYGIILHDNGEIIYANTTALITVGLPEKKINTEFVDYLLENKIDKKFLEDFTPGPLLNLVKTRRELLLSGEELPFIDIKINKITGEEIFIETRSTLVNYRGKQVIQITINDITDRKLLEVEQQRADLAEAANEELEHEIFERKKIQKALEENQEFTKSIFRSSLDMIMATSNELIIQANESAREKFGYSKEELLNMHPRNLYENKEKYELIQNVLDTNGFYFGEITNKRKDGSLFVSMLSASVIKDREGNVIGAMGISRDLSEAKNKEAFTKQQTSKLKSLFENSSDMMIWTVNKKLTISSFNQNFEKICNKRFGVFIKIQDQFYEIVKKALPKKNHRRLRHYFDEALKGHNRRFEIELKDLNGEKIWLQMFLSPIILDDGTVPELACLAHDITENKNNEIHLIESLNEKEILLKEVHHRVKNNLQVISSILNLQSSYVKDEKILEILRESQNRIKSMSFIHESLYQNKIFSYINFSDYLVNLSKNLVHSYQINTGFIELICETKVVKLNLDQSIPCGLIVNELLTNSLKYAFPNNQDGIITIMLEKVDSTVYLKVSDNGVGMDKNIDPENTETLGLQLVYTLVDQLNGKIELDRGDGTKYLITFDKEN